MTKTACVYMLASKKNGTLYTGVTSNLEQRIYQHKHHTYEGFTSKYGVIRLVWYECGPDITSAIVLEKKIKNRNRQWKIDLIEKNNPNWDDLAENWVDPATTPSLAQDDSLPVMLRVVAVSTSAISCEYEENAIDPATLQSLAQDDSLPVMLRAVAASTLWENVVK
jgi:putative endonuclease